ncbi:hypothetical protein C8R43DRAFT_1034878 [Mycena crocata]|nr:hypothetical protein C8R43DRAFT_1034878 [Mycena crocata]
MPVGRRRDPATLSHSLFLRETLDCTWAEGPCNLNHNVLCTDENTNQHCTCSAISYFLAAACEVCTTNSTLSWEEYRQSDNCPPDSPEKFPLPLPTVLPQWAVKMALATPTPTTFDITVASFIAVNSALPSSTSSSTATASSTSGSDPTQITSNEASPTSTSSSAASPLTAAAKGSSQVGPIAGGIIGGLIFLALVGTGIWYVMRRRRRNHIAPSAAYKAALRSGTPMPPYQPVHHESPKNSVRCPHSRPPSSD